MAVSKAARASMIALWTSGSLNGYDDSPTGEQNGPRKATAHKQAAAVLKDFAQQHLGLTTGQFEVRSNMGGVAVSGEVTLHTNPFVPGNLGIYVQIGQTCYPRASVLYRIVKGRKDFTGGPNNWAAASVFESDESMAEFAKTIKRRVGSH
jgi:hypothetical protein